MTYFIFSSPFCVLHAIFHKMSCKINLCKMELKFQDMIYDINIDNPEKFCRLYYAEDAFTKISFFSFYHVTHRPDNLCWNDSGCALHNGSFVSMKWLSRSRNFFQKLFTISFNGKLIKIRNLLICSQILFEMFLNPKNSLSSKL